MTPAGVRRPAHWRLAWVPVTAAAVAAALSLAACSGTAHTAAVKTTPTTTAASAPTTSPTSSSGLVPLQGGPVLAVKIDNTSRARPRIGLQQADVVYVEPVEGGLTRLLAVFSRTMPAEVGPVRSARESDVELVANYGRVALAYSGGSPYTRRVLDRGRQVNLSNDASGEGFRRERSRPAPYNVIGNTERLLARAGDSAKPKDVGFRFGPASPGGRKATSVSARWPSSRVSLVWDAKRKQYLVTTDGKPDLDPKGRQYGAATVVVQHVSTRLSANRDVNGVATPVVTLTGKGKAVVLRGGKAWSGSWARTSATAPTTLTAGGKPIALAPDGPVWVLLVAPGQGVAIG